jgi:hypothetical protein
MFESGSVSFEPRVEEQEVVDGLVGEFQVIGL